MFTFTIITEISASVMQGLMVFLRHVLLMQFKWPCLLMIVKRYVNGTSIATFVTTFAGQISIHHEFTYIELLIASSSIITIGFLSTGLYNFTMPLLSLASLKLWRRWIFAQLSSQNVVSTDRRNHLYISLLQQKINQVQQLLASLSQIGFAQLLFAVLHAFDTALLADTNNEKVWIEELYHFYPILYVISMYLMLRNLNRVIQINDNYIAASLQSEMLIQKTITDLIEYDSPPVLFSELENLYLFESLVFVTYREERLRKEISLKNESENYNLSHGLMIPPKGKIIKQFSHEVRIPTNYSFFTLFEFTTNHQ